jgi:hypothetical protein
MKIQFLLCVLLALVSFCSTAPHAPTPSLPQASASPSLLFNEDFYVSVSYDTNGIVYSFGANKTKLTSTFKLSGLGELLNDTLFNKTSFGDLSFVAAYSRDKTGQYFNLTATPNPPNLRLAEFKLAHTLKNDSKELQIDYYLSKYQFAQADNRTKLVVLGNLISTEDKKNVTAKDDSISTSESFYQISTKASASAPSDRLLLVDDSVTVKVSVQVKGGHDVWTVYDHFNKGVVLTHQKNLLGLGKAHGKSKTWLFIVIGVAVALAVIAAIVVACIVVKKRKNYEVV